MVTTTARRTALAALLGATALLYLWDLSASGWANSFYSAAVQAGSQSWKALLFGSSDAGNAITVDKTPAALWVMGLSARVFGFSSWSVLVPQALEGVASVWLLYATVRRTAGTEAGLLAGAVLAATPVAALMFRFDNPDALLVLLLIAAAYCVVRALEPAGSRWWLPLAGVAIGFAFLAKMMQAFLVLPVFGLVFLLAAHAPLRQRILRLAGAFVALVVSGGWYLLLVSLWPADSRPYIGGSQHDSIVELALGYNGFGRLTGDETGGLGNPNFDIGWGRLFGADMGGQISWLLPAAVVVIVAGVWLTRRSPRTDPVRASLLLWGGWLLVTGVVFSFMQGISHGYYTIALAPAIAGAIGVGIPLLWQRRNDIRAATTLAGIALITTALSCTLLGRNSDWLPWLRPAVAVIGVGAAVLLLARRQFARTVMVLGLSACLAGPLAYSVATAATPHTGAIPSAGPSSGRFAGGPFQSVEPGAALTAALADDASEYTWAAAAIGSTNAAGYQLASGAPVLAIGGFNGTDPAPTLAEFETSVAQGKIHYFIDSNMPRGMGGSSTGSDESAAISAWVKEHFNASTIDGTTVYDLAADARA